MSSSLSTRRVFSGLNGSRQWQWGVKQCVRLSRVRVGFRSRSTRIKPLIFLLSFKASVFAGIKRNKIQLPPLFVLFCFVSILFVSHASSHLPVFLPPPACLFFECCLFWLFTSFFTHFFCFLFFVSLDVPVSAGHAWAIAGRAGGFCVSGNGESLPRCLLGRTELCYKRARQRQGSPLRRLEVRPWPLYFSRYVHGRCISRGTSIHVF